jgi:acetyltransferase-like isoleucine patch superfamily enzyme
VNQAYDLPFRAIGQDVVIYAGARILAPDCIELGNRVIIDDFVLLMGGRSSRIGSFVHIAAFASIAGGGDLVMEDFSGVSGGCRIYTGNDDYNGGSLTGPTVPHPYRIPIRSFVRIGKHAVVGANSVVLPGVTIGEGAAIGANSVVTADCEPWTICVGAPARPLKPRRRERMLEMEAALRSELFDGKGRYRPNAEREEDAPHP